MAREDFLELPALHAREKSNYDYDIAVGRCIHIIEEGQWEPEHEIQTYFSLIKNRHKVFQKAYMTKVQSKDKSHLNEEREAPISFFIQSIKLQCKHPDAGPREAGLKLWSAFEEVDPGLTRLSYAKESKEFAKLRALYGSDEMQAAIDTLELRTTWSEACAKEDAFLAYENELLGRESIAKRNTQDKRRKLHEVSEALFKFLLNKANIMEDEKATHVVENLVEEMKQWNSIQKAAQTRKQNAEE